MQKLELFDETFDPDRTESYELSIQVSLNGFSFCVKDLSRNLFICLVYFPFSQNVKHPEEWPKYVKQLVLSYSWLSKSFKKVLFCFESPSYSVVPVEFFEPEKAKLLLSTVHALDTLDEIWFNKLPSEMVSIFNIPSSLVSSWIKLQKKTRFIGYCDPAIHFHHLSVANPMNPIITISLSNCFSVVIVSKNLKLLHCGSIDAQSPEDTVYHMLNICQKLKLSTDGIKVKLLGNTNELEQLESLIDRFFLSSVKEPNFEQNHFSYLLNKHKGQFANLFNQSLCE